MSESDFISSKGIPLDKVIDCIGDAIVVADNDFTIHTVNTKLAELYGLKKEQLIGLNPFILYPDFKKSVFYEGTMRTVTTGEAVERVGFSERLNKWLTMKTYRYDENNYIMVLKDLKETEEKTLYAKQIDLLTALPNRFFFEQELNNLLNIKQAYSLILVDIDRFHDFNDSFGFEVGDLCLMQVAQKIKMLINPEDRLYKVGIDQYLILSLQGKDESLNKLENVIKFFEDEISINNKSYLLSISAGFYGSTAETLSPQEAFQKVESALIFSKKHKTKFCEYESHMSENKNDFGIVKDVKEAIKNNEFELFYQPQADLLDMKTVGAEALIRWKKPGDNFYTPPFKFIPIAEETGLIGEIDKWVIVQSFKDINRLKERGVVMPISINMSSMSICDFKIVDFIEEKLKEFNIEGESLVVEITETSLMSNEEKSKQVIAKLKQLGIKISIDDFGTGYSSMSYLLKYPAHYLKIDREFIKDISNLKTHKIMVQNIIKIGQSLNMSIIAEGTETEEEMNILKNFGCEYIQGFGYARPLPFKEFVTFVGQKGISNAKSNLY